MRRYEFASEYDGGRLMFRPAGRHERPASRWLVVVDAGLTLVIAAILTRYPA